MTYALSIGPWLVGPFPTSACAQHWAETHGCDNWELRELDDPCEAPLRISNPSALVAGQRECLGV